MALIEAPLPPLVWPGWRPTVLLPQSLIDSLNVSQRRLLLLHEFEHIRRRDHRVRWFQIGVVALYWWNPVAWWAARRLERAEEECCDTAVLCFHPDQSAGYGQTLLAVSEFLSTGKFPAPALSISMARKNHLKRRLTMILNGPRWPRLSKTRLAVFAMLGAGLIAVTWTAATAQNAPLPAVKSVPTPSTRQPEAPIPKPAKAPAIAAEIQLMRLRADLKEKQPERVTVAVEPGPAVQTSTPRQLPALLTAEPVEPAPGDDQRQKLLKERYNAALRSLKASYNRRKIDTAVPFMGVIAAARQILPAEVALHKSEDMVRVHARYLELMKFLEKEAADQFHSFTGLDEVEAAHEARLDAEIKLLDAKSGRSQTQTKDAAALAMAEYEASNATAKQRVAALTLARAKADLLLLKTQYDRIVRLYEQKAIDPGLVTDLRNKRDAAAAAVDKAQATFGAAESEATLKRVQLDRLTNGSETKRAEPMPPANSTPAPTR